MAEPSNAEIKVLVEALTARTERSDADRIAWQTRTGDAVKDLSTKFQNHVVEVGTRLERVERQSAGADDMARKALTSYTNLEELLRVQSVQHHSDVMDALKAQNEERDEIRRQEDARKQRESEAAAKVAADKKANDERVERRRDFHLKLAGVLVPIALALIGLVQVVMHMQLEAKIAQLQQGQQGRPSFVAPPALPPPPPK